jgi:hypothetical protein
MPKLPLKVRGALLSGDWSEILCHSVEYAKGSAQELREWGFDPVWIEDADGRGVPAGMIALFVMLRYLRAQKRLLKRYQHQLDIEAAIRRSKGEQSSIDA